MPTKTVIVMVGLPARGKSYITRKISNYLTWLNVDNKIFNVGNRRRVACDDKQDASFFDPHCVENVRIRDSLAMETLDEVLTYLADGGQAAIFDATNSTSMRREMVVSHINSACEPRGVGECNVMFLESICDDVAIVEQNMRLKLNGPDYRNNVDKMSALDDFKQRLSNYEAVYETLTQAEIQHPNVSYIKIINVFNLDSYNVQGFIPVMLNSFLSNFNIHKKKIWISLNHIEYADIRAIVDSVDLMVCSTSPLANRRIPAQFSIDQVHDLILDIEASEKDILIHTGDELLINGVLKYFNLLDECHPDLATQLVCINPHHYSVGLQKFNILEIPEMSRSTSNISTYSSNIFTPKTPKVLDDCNLVDNLTNYKNLNMLELQAKLTTLLPPNDHQE